MRIIKILTILIIMLCASCAKNTVREQHSLDGWQVVYNDFKAMKEACALATKTPGILRGCTDFQNKIIYCAKDDLEACGKFRQCEGCKHA